MNKFIRVTSGQCSAKQKLSSRKHKDTRLQTEYSGNNLFQKHQFLNIYDRTAKIQGKFQMRAACCVLFGITIGWGHKSNQSWTNSCLLPLSKCGVFFRKPHTTPRTIPDRSAKLLYLQRLLRRSCYRSPATSLPRLHSRNWFFVS